MQPLWCSPQNRRQSLVNLTIKQSKLSIFSVQRIAVTVMPLCVYTPFEIVSSRTIFETSRPVGVSTIMVNGFQNLWDSLNEIRTFWRIFLKISQLRLVEISQPASILIDKCPANKENNANACCPLQFVSFFFCYVIYKNESQLKNILQKPLRKSVEM